MSKIEVLGLSGVRAWGLWFRIWGVTWGPD